MIRKLVVLLALLGLCALGPSLCQGPPPYVQIDSPSHRAFVDAENVTVEGITSNFNPFCTDVFVNGVAASVVANGGQGSWSATIPLDAPTPVNGIEVQFWNDFDHSNPELCAGGSVLIDEKKIFVTKGPSTADGDYSDMSVVLRINQSGLDAIEPIVTSLVDLDFNTLGLLGTQVISDFCYLDGGFLGCLGAVDVTVIDGMIGSFGIDIDAHEGPPQNGYAEGDVTLNNLQVVARVDDSTGVPLTCYVTVTAATTNIPGDYGLQPDAVMPSEIDVVQLVPNDVIFGGFNDNTDCDGLLGGFVELLIGLFIGDIQDLMEPAFEGFLNQNLPGDDDPPIASAVEEALAGIELSGPIGNELGIMLETPLFTVDEDENGLTLGSDSKWVADPFSPPGPGQCEPVQGAPNLTASLEIPQAFPTLGPLTPMGDPYDIGLCLGASAFNQFMKALTECGLLATELTEIDFGGGPTPLTNGSLSVVLPPFHDCPPAFPGQACWPGWAGNNEPLRIRITPTMAPVITGNSGPNGELAEMSIGGLIITILADKFGNPNWVAASAWAEVRLGFDLQYDPMTSSLVPSLSAPTPDDLTVFLIDENIGQNLNPGFEDAVENFLPQVFAPVLPSLASALGAIPIPSLLGLNLDAVDVDHQGDFMSVYLEVVP